jgi:hypothetical protein
VDILKERIKILSTGHQWETTGTAKLQMFDPPKWRPSTMIITKNIAGN